MRAHALYIEPMKSFIETERKRLLCKYHTLCRQLSMSDEERKAMLWQNYKVESSADLDNHQLIDLCGSLEKHAHPKMQQQSRERKRVIASIGGWLRLCGKEKADAAENLAYIKSIACRATQYEDFNAIPTERLRNLYATFANKQKDKRAIEKIIAEDAGKEPRARSQEQGDITSALLLAASGYGVAEA